MLSPLKALLPRSELTFSSPKSQGWVTFITIAFCLPTANPVDSQTLNYTVVAVGIVALGTFGTWFLWARKWFTGPRQGEFSIIRRSLQLLTSFLTLQPLSKRRPKSLEPSSVASAPTRRVRAMAKSSPNRLWCSVLLLVANRKGFRACRYHLVGSRQDTLSVFGQTASPRRKGERERGCA